MPVSVSAGGTANYTLALTPEGGFKQVVNLACPMAPAYATPTVTPTSLTLEWTNKAWVSVKASTAGTAMVPPGPGNFGLPPSGSLTMAVWLALLGLLTVVKFSPKGGRVRRLAP